MRLLNPSLTVGALIGAPTVREGFPARAQYYAVGALDFYTKAVLTIIAFMLTVIACKTVISPETTASAQGPFTSVQFDASAKTFFDTRTGEIWIYRDIPVSYTHLTLPTIYSV